MGKKSDFDCVEMQHRGGAALQALLDTMTKEQRMEYWRKGTEELRAHQAELRRAAETQAASAEA